MMKMVEMTVWIRLVYGSEKVKDQDVDEAHGYACYLGGIIALLLQDHHTMSTKSVCSSQGVRGAHMSLILLITGMNRTCQWI